MKIIDRYVLVTFLKNYIISFLVLVGMYVALDMVFNFGNLTQSRGTSLTGLSIFRILYDIGDFYFYQTFVFFVHLSGIISVVAAAFTLMRLSRFNETTALMAAGMPLWRVALWIGIAGISMNLLLLPIDQELVIPKLIPKLMREHSDIHSETAKTYAVTMMQDSAGNLFNAGLYTAPTSISPAEVQVLDVIERDKTDLHPTGHLLADRAVWNEQENRWDLTGGQHVVISSPSQPSTPNDDKSTPVSTYQSDINPQEISLYLSKDFIQFLSIADLNLLLHRGKSYGTANLLRTWDMRWTQPLANIILLALAISSTLTREPGRLKSAVSKCVMLTTLCMGTIFVTYELAGNAPNPGMISLWPALMAWIPIFIFGPLAALLLRRLPT